MKIHEGDFSNLIFKIFESLEPQKYENAAHFTNHTTQPLDVNGTPWSRGMALVFGPLYSEFEFPVCSNLFFYLFFANFNTFWGSGGLWGFEFRPETDIDLVPPR